MAYCHDSVGIGHLRRTLAICERIGASHPDCSFLLATGTPYISLFSEQFHVDCIKLPALAKESDGHYHSRYLSLSLEELLRCRSSLLLEAARTYRPDVMLVDKAPLGVCRELVPTLRWLRQNRPDVRIVFGMRDIEDDPQVTIRAWTGDGVQEVIEECYDEVWVYGMPSIFDVAAQYRLPPAVQRKLRYMGYIARPPCPHDSSALGQTSRSACEAPRPQPTVLVTVGGGTDGERILSCYLDAAAARVGQVGARSVVVGGPDLPKEAGARLRQRAAQTPATHWLDFEPCMSCRIRRADLVVTMGGYNTLCELAVQRKPALVIPRTKPRLEQKIRAELWERLGAVRMLREGDFHPAGLADRVAELLRDPPAADHSALDLNGLEHVAERFASFFSPAQEARRAAAVRL